MGEVVAVDEQLRDGAQSFRCDACEVALFEALGEMEGGEGESGDRIFGGGLAGGEDEPCADIGEDERERDRSAEFG